jgi:dienelactone hydrolase
MNYIISIYGSDDKLKIGIILVGVVAFILLLVSSVHAVEVNTMSSPDETGPYHIGYYKISYVVPPYGRYWAKIRYPAIRDGWMAPKDTSEAPYPGIVVSNGFGGSEWNIKWIPEHLTSYGYVTICFTPPHKYSGDTTQWAYGFHGGIEKLKSQNSLWFSPIKDMVDVETFGAIGLSMGGGGCIEATGAPNSEIDAAVPLAPASSDTVKDAAKNITVPTQLQVGNNDGMVPPEHVIPFYTEFIPETSVKEYLSITGGNHIGFVDEFFARIAERLNIDNPKGIEFEEQRRISSKYFTAWFQYHLKELDDYYTYIFGEEAQNDMNNGILTDLKYNIP